MDAVKDTLKSWLAPAVIVAVFALGMAPVYVMLNQVQAALVRLDEKIDVKVDSVRTELKGDIGSLRTELKNDIRALSERLDKTRDELRDEIRAVRTELKGEIRAVRTELKGEINNVRTELKEDIRVLGVRLDTTRDGLDRRMDATTARVDALAIRVDAVERGDPPANEPTDGKAPDGNATGR